jgi:hypothetical protein
MNKRTIDLTIISMMAAAAGRNNCYWRGDCEINADKQHREVNNEIFRMFNRVDEEDVAYLEKIGYDLPSLSIGDVIVYEEKAYIVKTTGFKEVKEQLYTTMFSS